MKKAVKTIRFRRMGHDYGNRAFTMIEVLIVIVLLAIAAVAVVPMISSAGSFQIRSAANTIASDLEYAKSMAITTGQTYSVVFDKDSESYLIADSNGTTILHPINKGFDYVVTFGIGTRLDRVDIEDAVFQSGSNATVTFDYLGSPYSGSDSSTALNSGDITLTAGSSSKTVSIEPVTGFISISE